MTADRNKTLRHVNGWLNKNTGKFHLQNYTHILVSSEA